MEEPRAPDGATPGGAARVVLGGRYHLQAPLGRGGTATVFAAHDEVLGAAVAVKLLRRELLDQQGLRSRFEREARLLARLDSPHVVRVLDFGDTSEVGPFMVMERLYGCDLGAALDAGPLAVDAALDYARQACRGLIDAHAAGLIHRDIKPSNLFLEGPDGAQRIRIVDFGVAKAESIDTSLTATGEAVGSPKYMSPEQVRNARDVGPATDLWSLGVTLFELLTDRSPFVGDTGAAIAASIVADPPRSLAALRPEVPRSVVRIVERCLAKAEGDRYPDAAELEEALGRALRGEPGPEVEEAIVAGPVVAVTRPPTRPRAAHRRVLGGVAVLTVTGVGVAHARAAALPDARSPEAAGEPVGPPHTATSSRAPAPSQAADDEAAARPAASAPQIPTPPSAAAAADRSRAARATSVPVPGRAPTTSPSAPASGGGAAAPPPGQPSSGPLDDRK